MHLKDRLSREEKGKAVATASSLDKDVTANGSPLEDFELIHRDAMRDTVNMDLSQRLLVADAHRSSREEQDCIVVNEESEEDDSSRAGSDSDRASADSDGSGSSDSSPQALWERHLFLRYDLIDYRPTVYHPGGIFEELPTLPPELLRDPWAEGQRWRNVFGSCSSHSSVRGLLRRYSGAGVTYLIPSPEKRPWSPPFGYRCLYESYFEDDSKLWFPIPRLITAYVRRRGIAISQLKNGSFEMRLC